MMKSVARRLEEELGIPRKSVRIFSNSRIPEKPLLAAAGIASYGKNSLALAPRLGSLFVIAGAILPLPSFEHATSTAAEPWDPCGSCRRCIDACPAGAIIEPGLVDPGLCLQGLAASPVTLTPDDMEIWGTRLYGCQDCQVVCPHNVGLAEEAPDVAGGIGPSVSLRRFLSLDAATLKDFFRGTPMGLSWVSTDALLRNALIAAGNRRDPAARLEVERFAASESRMLRETAQWALERLPAG